MEFVYTQAQTVANGGNLLLNNKYDGGNPNIFHSNESGVITLRPVINNPACNRFAQYSITCVCNIAIPTGGTVEEISIALAVSGEQDISTRSRFTPAAVNEFGSVTINTTVRVPAGCCKNIAVEAIVPSGGSLTAQEVNVSVIRTA